MNYLVIDDNQDFSEVLCRALKKRDHQACFALNSEQAYQLCDQQLFERIVLDLKLESESGLNILPELKKRQPQALILIVTGYSSVSTAVKAMQRGAVNYLCKPASADEIESAFTPDQDSDPDEPMQLPSVGRLEWEHIQKVLDKHEGNISATARALGMHRRTLQRKLQKRPVKE